MKKLLAIIIIAMLATAFVSAQDVMKEMFTGKFENQLLATYGDSSNFSTAWQNQAGDGTGSSAYLAVDSAPVIQDTMKWKPGFTVFSTNAVKLDFNFEERIISTLDASVANGVALTDEFRSKPQFNFTFAPNSLVMRWVMNVMPEERTTWSWAAGVTKQQLILSLENEGRLYINATDYIGIRPIAYYATIFEKGKTTQSNLQLQFDLRSPSFDDTDLLKNSFTTTPKILKGLGFRIRELITLSFQPTYFKDSDPTQQAGGTDGTASKKGSDVAFYKNTKFETRIQVYLNILGFAGLKGMDFGPVMYAKVVITKPYSSGTEESTTIAQNHYFGLYFSKTTAENHVFEFAAQCALNLNDTYNASLGFNGSVGGYTAAGADSQSYYGIGAANTIQKRPQGSGTCGINLQFDYESPKRTVRYHFEYEGLARIRAYDVDKDNFSSAGVLGAVGSQWSNKFTSYVGLKW